MEDALSLKSVIEDPSASEEEWHVLPSKEIDDQISAEIQNVVASIDLHAKINLEKAAANLPANVQVSYIPEQFPGVVMKLQEPKVSVLVFGSGKLVVTGAKTYAIIEEAVKIISDLLREIGHKIDRKPDIVVQNIVASGSLGRRINLEMAALLLDNCMYEPEQFPGLIYRMDEPKVVLLLFQSGKLVCTGAKKEEYVYQSIRNIYEQLDEIEAFTDVGGTLDEGELGPEAFIEYSG